MSKKIQLCIFIKLAFFSITNFLVLSYTVKVLYPSPNFIENNTY